MKKAAAAFTLPTGCAVARREREVEAEATGEQTKQMCVRSVRGPTNEQNNKTQSLNAKQVFLVCSFPPPWPKPKAQATAQSSPTHTQTVARKQWLKNKTTATIEFIVVKALYAVFTTKQQQNVSIIMLCIFKEFDSSPNLTPSDR